jgi:hypothetical protein
VCPVAVSAAHQRVRAVGWGRTTVGGSRGLRGRVGTERDQMENPSTHGSRPSVVAHEVVTSHEHHMTREVVARDGAGLAGAAGGCRSEWSGGAAALAPRAVHVSTCVRTDT